jgi:hypothetical protein
MRISCHQPTWVCVPCGEKYSLGNGTDMSTFHDGTCHVCGKKASVTEPRDFGYLKETWVDHVIKA